MILPTDRRRLILSAAAALTSTVAALGFGTAQAQNIPGVAARVNGTEISNFRLERHFEEYLKAQRRNVTAMINPRVYKKLKREALDQLIERELLWQAAEREGVFADADEVRGALERMQEQAKGRDNWLRGLAQAGFDEPAYAEYLRRELSGVRYLARKSDAAPAVDDAEVAEFYTRNRHRFEQPEAAGARHLLAKVAPTAPPEERAAAQSRAAAWREQLRAGADFGELARRHSDDGSAAAGGDLGAVARGRTVKPFEDALFALEPGGLSDVVQTGFGYHVIRMDSRTPARTQPLDEVREPIRKRLQAERRAALARDIVAGLKTAARIEVLVQLD